MYLCRGRRNCRQGLRLPSLFLAGLLCGVNSSSLQAQWTQEPNAQSIRLKPLDMRLEAPVVTAMVVSADKQWFAASGDDHAIRIVDFVSGIETHLLTGHADWVQCLQKSPDGDAIVSCGNDGTVRIWRQSQGWRSEVLFEGDDALDVVAFHPNGEQIFFAGFGHGVYVLEVASKRIERIISKEVLDIRSIDVSRDGEQIAFGGRDGKLYIYDLSSNEVIFSPAVHTDRIRAVRFSDDSSIVTSVGEDRRLCRFDLLTETIVFDQKLPSGRLMSVAMIDQVTTAISGSDNSIHFFCCIQNMDIGRVQGHRGSVRVMQGDADTLLTAGYDTVIRKWELPQIWDMLESAPRGLPVSSEADLIDTQAIK